MKSVGYREQFDPREAHAGHDGIAPGQYSFVSHPQNILAEFHTERTLRYFPIPIDFHDLTSRLMTIEIGEYRLRTFSIEDTLVMLCVHGAKHFWERLGWVLDIAKLAAGQEVDWALVTQIASKMESTRVLRLGLYLSHDLFGAPLSGQLLEEIGRDRTVQELAEKVYEQYAGISDPGAGVLHRAAFRFRLRDGIGQGLRHTLRLAMSPTERDRQIVRLPRWLTPLYMLVRPLRLLTGIWIWPKAPVNGDSPLKRAQLGYISDLPTNKIEMSNHGWLMIVAQLRCNCLLSGALKLAHCFWFLVAPG